MKTYLIAYDLLKPGQNYEDLIDAIKAYGTWAHVQESLWLVNSGDTAASIRDNLTQHIDANDKLFVCSVGPQWASRNLGSKVNEWLKDCWQADVAYAA